MVVTSKVAFVWWRMHSRQWMLASTKVMFSKSLEFKTLGRCWYTPTVYKNERGDKLRHICVALSCKSKQWGFKIPGMQGLAEMCQHHRQRSYWQDWWQNGMVEMWPDPCTRKGEKGHWTSPLRKSPRRLYRQDWSESTVYIVVGLWKIHSRPS